MESLGINLTDNTSWPQVVVIVAGLCYLSVQRWLDSKKVGQVAADAKATRVAADIVAHEMHTNSGSSMRDAIDRIEVYQRDHVKIAKERERVVDRRFAKIERRLGIK